MNDPELELAMEAAVRRLEAPHGDLTAWRDQTLMELGIPHDDFERVRGLCEEFISLHDEELRGALSTAMLMGFFFGTVLGRREQ